MSDYLTAEQYEYARKTGDWESGKVLTHGQALNDNQKIVLEWLREQVSVGNDLQYVLWEFTDNVYEEPMTYSVSEQTKAWLELTEQEQFQVLSAFADWGKKEVAE